MSKTYDCERNLSTKVFIGNQMVYSWKCMNLFTDSLATIWLTYLFSIQLARVKTPPSPLENNWGERRLWIAVVDRVPIYPECGGKPLVVM